MYKRQYQSPLALADNVIASFIYSRKSHYIFQPAIGSFYEGAQYDHKELVKMCIRDSL